MGLRYQGIAFGKLVWPISAVCFGPPPGTLKVWEIFIPWSSGRWGMWESL
jgi:hypothetical protein